MLKGANLAGANLEDAHLYGANLAGAVVTVSDNGDQHQSLVAKSRLSDIRPDMED